MNKLFLTGIMLASLSLSLAACKNNSTDKPETSLPSAQSSVVGRDNTDNGKVTDGNGIIGDKDDKTSNRTENSGGVVSEIVSDAESITESAAEGIENGVSKAVSGAESVAEIIGDGIENGASKVESAVESITDTASDDN